MAVNDEQIGNANTKLSSYGSVGALDGLFSQDIANQAMSISNQLYPQLPEPDPWEAAFQFFTEMGRQASQPGATVLGSAVGSMQAPLDYLNAKKKEKAESDRARMQSTISLGTALKGKGGYSNVTVDGKPTVMTQAEITAAKAAGKIVVPYEKPTTTTDKTRMNVVLKDVIDDPKTEVDERISSILRKDFDETKHLPTDALPPDRNPPQGSAGERLTSRVLNFVDDFVVDTEKPVNSKSLARFISDVSDMSKTETITFVENGVSKTATNPGKDAYKIIEQSYGIEIANKIRQLASQESIVLTGEGGGEGEGGENPKTETIIIAGKEFTVVSSAPKNIPKEAAQGIVDARGGMRDVKIASDLIFPEGIFNKKLVVASNILPGGGVGSEGSLTGDARTAYQAMKRSIELLLRARSGAAVPPAEVENYMTLYYPSSFDNESQAKNKLAVLAQYFTDTNQLLSQGKLLYDPTVAKADRKYDATKHGIPVDSSASGQANEAPSAVTVTSEWELDGKKYKQLSNGQIIEEE